MDELESPHGGYYVEPPELLARNLNVGARLFIAAQIFFYGGFLFAFFYLRELNTGGMWHPDRVDAPVGWGAAISACVVASALVSGAAIAAMRRRNDAAWRPGAAVALALGVAALALQCIEWATLGFGAGDGGFASVFVAWTGFYMAFGLLGGLYWLETTLATSIRHRGEAPGLVVAAAEAPAGARGTKALTAPSAEAATINLYFLAVVSVVMFILLYVVG